MYIRRSYITVSTWARIELFNSQCLNVHVCELWGLRRVIHRRLMSLHALIITYHWVYCYSNLPSTDGVHNYSLFFTRNIIIVYIQMSCKAERQQCHVTTVNVNHIITVIRKLHDSCVCWTYDKGFYYSHECKHDIHDTVDNSFEYTRV